MGARERVVELLQKAGRPGASLTDIRATAGLTWNEQLDLEADLLEEDLVTYDAKERRFYWIGGAACSDCVG